MDRDLGSVLDRAPLDGQQVSTLLRNLAISLQAIHKAGDRWDQSERRVLITQELAIKSIGTVTELRRKLPQGSIDLHRDYLPPEYMISGTEDYRGDVWAWGNIAYEAITGKRPFTGKTVYETTTARLDSEAIPPIDVNPQCSRALSEIVSKSLKRDPSQRYQSAGELIDALNEIWQ